MSREGAKLPTQAEKVLPYTIRPHLLAYCSRTDLFAVVTEEEVVDVYRLGGQRAFSVKRKSPSTTVVGLEWIRDGKCLAIALSSGNVDIVSGETGKIVRHGGDDPFTSDASGSQPTPGAITCLGWGTTLTGNVKIGPKIAVKSSHSAESKDSGLSTEDWYDELGENTDGDSQTKDAMLNDLPRQLAFIDVESVLPRLSPIAPRANAGGHYDMFATQSALDAYFNSMQRKDRLAAEVMLIGHEGGLVRLVIDDILEVNLSPKDRRRDSGPAKEHLLYRSHPQSPHHALLRAEPCQGEEQDGGKSYQRLALSLFDIPLLSSGGSHLHLIVSRTAQVRDLCSYISYSILCAKSDWTTHTNLPSRFMENINETLEEKGEGTLEQNLYHLAMLGKYSPTILEWLRDELAERGHKRWDHAMTTLYTDLSKLLQTNLLPALERCILVTTNLRGLALYYEGSKKFDVSPSSFSAIISALGMLQLLVHEAIKILGEEQRQFKAFSKWLRYSIDLAAADPTSVSAKDMAEREASNLDYPRILEYLEGALTDSRLKPMVHFQADPEAAVGDVDLDAVVQSIRQARKGIAERKELLSLHTLSTHLNTVCRAAHAQILRWQNSASPSIDEYELATGAVSNIFDMRVIRTAPGVFKTMTITNPRDEKNKISLHAVSKESNPANPSKTPNLTAATTISLPPTSQPLALKFLDDSSLLLLLLLSPSSEKSHHLLLLLPYNASSATTTTSAIANKPPDLSLGDRAALAQYTIHTFSANDPFTPVEMVVGTRSGRRSVTVIGAGYRTWRVFDLEAGISSAVRRGGGGGGGGEMGEMDGEGGFISESDEEDGEGESMLVD